MWNPASELQRRRHRATNPKHWNETSHSPQTSRDSHRCWWLPSSWKKHFPTEHNYEQNCRLLQHLSLNTNWSLPLCQIPPWLQISPQNPKLPLLWWPIRRNEKSCVTLNVDKSPTRNENNHSIRTHIAQDRVAQPPYFGGLSVPDPIIQSKSLSFSWARKFTKPNQALTWTKILEATLATHRRPTISQHTAMGFNEWVETAEAIEQSSNFWSTVFKNIGHFIKLSHEFD